MLSYYNLAPDHLVVVHDELDIDPGQLRVKFGGGDNGHNGLKSIRRSLGAGDYFRVRFGVGRPPGRQEPADFLLSNFSAAGTRISASRSNGPRTRSSPWSPWVWSVPSRRSTPRRSSGIAGSTSSGYQSTCPWRRPVAAGIDGRLRGPIQGSMAHRPDPAAVGSQRMPPSRVLRRDRRVQAPPVTPRVSPVVHADAGDSRKATAAATSSTVPSRRIGWLAIRSPRI